MDKPHVGTLLTRVEEDKPIDKLRRQKILEAERREQREKKND